MNLKLLYSITLCVFFTSCAGMMQDYKDRTCSYEGAYQQGMNDAREEKK